MANMDAQLRVTNDQQYPLYGSLNYKGSSFKIHIVWCAYEIERITCERELWIIYCKRLYNIKLNISIFVVDPVISLPS